MPLPDGGVTVEIEFTGGVWTNVTSDLLPDGWTLRRGRSNEADTIQPMTCSFALWNRTGDYTPGNPGSPHYGKVLVNKRVRVSTVHSATTYRRFVGYVDAWVERFGEGAVAPVVEVSATDMFKPLGRRSLRPAALEDARVQGAAKLWLMDDPAGSLVADQFGGSPLTLQVGSAGAGTGTTSRRQDTTLVDFPYGISLLRSGTNSTIGYAATVDHTLAVPSSFAAEVAFKTTASGAGAYTALLEVTTEEPGLPGGTVWITAGFDEGAGSGQFRVEAFGASSTVATTLNDGTWHHLLFTYTGGVGSSVYVDGALLTTTGAGGGPGTNFKRITVGGYSRGTATKMSGIVGGTYAFAAYYPLAVATPTDRSPLVKAGYVSETADERAARIAEWAGFTLTAAAGSVSDDTLGYQAVSGQSAVQALVDVANTEGGVIVSSRDGSGLSFRGRRYSPTTVTAAASTALLGDAIDMTLDDRVMVNQSTVTLPTGESGFAEDTASVTAHGEYAETIDSLHDGANRAVYDAQARVARFANPAIRAPRIAFNLYAGAVPYASAFGLDCLDRVELTGLVDTAPLPEITVTVEGYTERATPDSYTLELDTGPSDAPAFVKFDSETNGRFGGAPTLAAGITSGATTLTSTTASASLRWTTTDEPFDIVVDGEVMTVTNVTETGSGPWTATLTVTRGAKAVAHSLGATIKLYPTPTFGW